MMLLASVRRKQKPGLLGDNLSHMAGLALQKGIPLRGKDYLL
jgi:hypothetical protein